MFKGFWGKRAKAIRPTHLEGVREYSEISDAGDGVQRVYLDSSLLPFFDDDDGNWRKDWFKEPSTISETASFYSFGFPTRLFLQYQFAGYSDDFIKSIKTQRAAYDLAVSSQRDLRKNVISELSKLVKDHGFDENEVCIEETKTESDLDFGFRLTAKTKEGWYYRFFVSTLWLVGSASADNKHFRVRSCSPYTINNNLFYTFASKKELLPDWAERSADTWMTKFSDSKAIPGMDPYIYQFEPYGKEISPLDIPDEFFRYKYKVVPMEGRDGRFVIADSKSKRIIDDANGYGYPSKNAAWKGLDFILRQSDLTVAAVDKSFKEIKVDFSRGEEIDPVSKSVNNLGDL